MATQTFPHQQLAARRAVPLTAEFRQLRCDIARWALAHGRPCNLDAITVVLAAKATEAHIERRPLHRWTASGIATFLLGSTADFLRRHDVRRPDSYGETLFTYVAYLADQGLLSSGSAPRSELLSAVSEVAGLTRSGREPLRRGAVSDVRPLPQRAAVR